MKGSACEQPPAGSHSKKVPLVPLLVGDFQRRDVLVLSASAFATCLVPETLLKTACKQDHVVYAGNHELEVAAGQLAAACGVA